MGALLVRHEPNSVAAVRRDLTLDLRRHGIAQDCIDDAALVASELVGNAVRHTEVADGGELDVAWSVDPCSVVISVSDGSDTPPCLRRAAMDEPSGRGLTIVEQLSSAWGVEPSETGKRVWARVPLDHRVAS